jgi:hypothetical protein
MSDDNSKGGLREAFSQIVSLIGLFHGDDDFG